MAADLSKKLYVQNPEEWKQYLMRKRLFDDEPDIKIVERGIILPARSVEGEHGRYEGGVCDSDLNFVVGYFRKKDGVGGWKFNCMESVYEVDNAEILQLDEDVIFGGFIASNFGHFLMECLCRLWYVIQHSEMFKLMGIDKNRIVYVDKPVQCRSITVPEQAQYNTRITTKEFLLPYSAMKSTIAPGEHKKFVFDTAGL